MLYKDTNFPKTVDGQVLHLHVKEGQGRGARVATLLTEVATYSSPRGFVTYTGNFEGTPVSVVVTGMGAPNMDFFVREAREIVQGTMAIVRLGTCGLFQKHLEAGAVCVATEGNIGVIRNPDAWSGVEVDPYTITRPVFGDEALTGKVKDALVESFGQEGVVCGTNCSADSFYASQGRTHPAFDDRNENLLQRITENYPQVVSCEMESFHLLDLARISKGSIKAAAVGISLANRLTNDVLDSAKLPQMEIEAGRAILRALVQSEW